MRICTTSKQLINSSALLLWRPKFSWKIFDELMRLHFTTTLIIMVFAFGGAQRLSAVFKLNNDRLYYCWHLPCDCHVLFQQQYPQPFSAHPSLTSEAVSVTPTTHITPLSGPGSRSSPYRSSTAVMRLEDGYKSHICVCCPLCTVATSFSAEDYF
jgi:hypothetical protein